MVNSLQQSLLEDIRSSGVSMESINDLLRIDERHRGLVPILIKYLKLTRNDDDKEWIVRCLGVPGFTEASTTLIAEFKKSSNVLYKWAIGNTLAIIGDIDVSREMIELVKDKSHGIARQMIVQGLGKMRVPEAQETLLELLHDPDVTGHAIVGLSYYDNPSLVKDLEPLRNHKVAWIRKEVEKAIKRLDG